MDELLDRLDRLAQTQLGREISTGIVVTAGELCTLVRLARIGHATESRPPDETL